MKDKTGGGHPSLIETRETREDILTDSSLKEHLSEEPKSVLEKRDYSERSAGIIILRRRLC